MNYSQNFAISGLETLTIVVPIAGACTLSAKLKLPRLSQTDPTDPNYLDAPSQVVATIKQNGSTIYTTAAGQDGFSFPMLVAAQDSITVQLSSSAPQDEVLNAVSAVVSLA